MCASITVTIPTGTVPGMILGTRYCTIWPIIVLVSNCCCCYISVIMYNGL